MSEIEAKSTIHQMIVRILADPDLQSDVVWFCVQDA